MTQTQTDKNTRNWSNQSNTIEDNKDGDTNRGIEQHDFNQSDVAQHAFVRNTTEKKTTGKETTLVAGPEVSMSPTSGDSAEKQDNNWGKSKRLIVDNAIAPVPEKKYDFSDHPLLSLKRDQGVFIPNRPGLSTDELMQQIHKEVYHLRAFGAQVEKDINGDDILESIIIEEKKRHDDGTIQLTAGKPVVGALSQNRPKLVHACNFTVHAVTKDMEIADGQTAPEDGVLVIRVS